MSRAPRRIQRHLKTRLQWSKDGIKVDYDAKPTEYFEDASVRSEAAKKKMAEDLKASSKAAAREKRRVEEREARRAELPRLGNNNYTLEGQRNVLIKKEEECDERVIQLKYKLTKENYTSKGLKRERFQLGVLQRKVIITQETATPLIDEPPPNRRVFIEKMTDRKLTPIETFEDKVRNLEKEKEENDKPADSKGTDNDSEEEALEEFIDLGMKEFNNDLLEADEIDNDMSNLFPNQNQHSLSQHQAKAGRPGKTATTSFGIALGTSTGSGRFIESASQDPRFSTGGNMW